MNHDVFISYQSESRGVVATICNILEKNDVKCWYADRDVREQHAGEIVEAIQACKIFLIVVDDNVATHPRGDILAELDVACALYNRGKIKMIRLSITDNELSSMDLIYYIGRIQATNITGKPLHEGASELLMKIYRIIGRETAREQIVEKIAAERTSNNYFDMRDEKERRRLHIQQKLLKRFDADVYEGLLRGKSELRVFDLGCNEGGMTVDRFGSRPEVAAILAADINPEAIESATQKYGSDRLRFFALDCERDDFVDRVALIMEESDIEKFDIIHISMLILHLKNPLRLLQKLRLMLKKGGRLFIRDIDDTLTFAYPDPQGYFRRACKICDYEDLSGFRNSGKEIHSLLVRAGFRNVLLHKKGLDTTGMNPEERDAMFDAYFSFILEDTELLSERNPGNKRYAEDHVWLRSVFEELKSAFQQEEFLFQLGFMTYTAEK